ncbi:hypothetical protein NPIL_666861 [Nephila pilipes]|uniref:Uncharacterized protein n=1 Tax=Nephila pilipes TaxID=299642 RepID=A0A8X6TYW7_NEPPI|nr:hypothetical protein NPIL_666861 [Nephila pilipes]
MMSNESLSDEHFTYYYLSSSTHLLLFLPKKVASFHPSSRISDVNTPNYEPSTVHCARSPARGIRTVKGNTTVSNWKGKSAIKLEFFLYYTVSILDPEPISRSSPPKEASIHIDLRIEKALQNLSCSDLSEKDNASEFDWKKYMLSEHEEIKSDELESNLDATRARDETFRIRNGPERMSFVDTNTEDTNSSDI